MDVQLLVYCFSEDNDGLSLLDFHLNQFFLCCNLGMFEIGEEIIRKYY